MGLIIGVVWLEKHEYEYVCKQKLSFDHGACVLFCEFCVSQQYGPSLARLAH